MLGFFQVLAFSFPKRTRTDDNLVDLFFLVFYNYFVNKKRYWSTVLTKNNPSIRRIFSALPFTYLVRSAKNWPDRSLDQKRSTYPWYFPFRRVSRLRRFSVSNMNSAKTNWFHLVVSLYSNRCTEDIKTRQEHQLRHSTASRGVLFVLVALFFFIFTCTSIRVQTHGQMEYIC